MASPSPKPKIVVALGNGVTFDPKTGKKTTKPKPLPSPKSNSQYLKDQKKFIADNAKKRQSTKNK